MAINDQTLYLTRAELACLQPLIDAHPRSATKQEIANASGVPLEGVSWHMHKLRQRLATVAPEVTWAYPPRQGQYVLCSDAIEIEEAT
jgi:hypothetical protein